MKQQNFTELNSDELSAILQKLRNELVNLRLRKNTGQLEKTHKLRTLRQDIARCLTVQNSNV